MQVGSPVQWTPDGVNVQAGIIVGDVVEPVYSTDRNNPGLVTPGRADLVVWSAAGVQSFKNNVTQNDDLNVANTFSTL